MRLPTIHSNGTSAEALLDDQMKILGALREAEVLLRRCGPNGRDYYPQGESAVAEAMKDGDSRIERVRSVIREVEQIAEHVAGFVK